MYLNVIFQSVLLIFMVPAYGSSCGRPIITHRQSRILGGKLTIPGQHPWVVAILVMGRHRCGASVVSERWLLTAAHCLIDFHPPNYLISANRCRLAVDRAYLHTGFDMMRVGTNDIALLHLVTPLKFLQPICLPTRVSTNFTGRMATVLGWGITSEKGRDYSPLLRQVHVPLLSHRECFSWMIQAGRSDVAKALSTRGHLCAGYREGGRDACSGDSGGPLVVKDADQRFTVVGVASGGIGCGRKLLPGIYTRVSDYLTWIKNVMDYHTSAEKSVLNVHLS